MSKYLDENRNIRPELLDEEAESMAKTFVEYQTDRYGARQINEKCSLTSSQLRRFYGEFKRIHTKFRSLTGENKQEAFSKILPLIRLQRSRAAYASHSSDGKTKIPKEFYEFLTENIRSITNADEFDAFMLHFEAVVGFFYSQEGVRNN